MVSLKLSKKPLHMFRSVTRPSSGPPQSQYILSLLLLVVNNKNKFKLNSDVHVMDIRI